MRNLPLGIGKLWNENAGVSVSRVWLRKPKERRAIPFLDIATS